MPRRGSMLQRGFGGSEGVKAVRQVTPMAVSRGVSAAILLAASMSLPVLGDSEGVIVRRDGREALVRCSFSATTDLVVRVYNVANEDAYLVPRDMPITDFSKGLKIHSGGDDYSPIKLGDDFGYLSGNHGSYFGNLLTLPDHGFTAADVGLEAVHSSGGRYRVVNVPDKDHILVHPDGRAGIHPCFSHQEKGSFRLGGRECTPVQTKRVQVCPMSRIRHFGWKTGDGRTVPERVETPCSSVDLEIEHDVVDPRAVMAFLKAHPGGGRSMPELAAWESKRPKAVFLDDPEAAARFADFAKLDALISVRTVYRYEPGCARLALRTTTFVAPLANVDALDVIYGWNGSIGPWRNVEFYIPRMKKTTLRGFQGNPEVAVDMTAVERMPCPPWKVNYSVGRADCVDPENMPDRFIRIASDASGRRQVGVALGYSLLQGVTALENRSAERPFAYFFYPSGKMYPYSFLLENVPAGRTIVHHGYTQYFDPQQEPDATAFYHHRDGEAHVVYVDFHKTLAGEVVRLPRELVGKRISVLQRSPSVTLRTTDTVPPDGGIALDVADGYGELVLRID